MDWKHGYYAESGYTYGFFEEMTPARLAWIAALKGYPASLDIFRYLDLGCGQGLNLLILASLYPSADFVGVDYMPEHIAHGTELASSAGLNNVRFLEADFVELAREPEKLGDFDYVVAHGVTTWVSPEIREGLFQVAQAVLKPNGLMYNSYNTFPGWLHATPFQNMVLQFQKKLDGKGALEATRTLFTKLIAGGSAIKDSLPGLQTRIEKMATQDPTYLVQEYNNNWWQPVYSNQMLELASRHKLKLIGSAGLTDNFDDIYPADLRSLIQQETDPILRESVRDLAMCQVFRRDIYIKGGAKRWSVENQRVISERRFVAVEFQPVPPVGQTFTWTVGSINITGNRDSYVQLLEAFGTQGRSVGEVTEILNEKDSQSVASKASMLLQGHWLALEGPIDTTNAARLNYAMARGVINGAPYEYLAVPKLSTAIRITDLDYLLVGLSENDNDVDTLARKLLRCMSDLGKRFADNGAAVEEEHAMMELARRKVASYLNEQKIVFTRIGAI